MPEPIYNYRTPFLQPMIQAVSEGNREQAIEWSLNEIERPIRRLKRRYPEYTTPRDCKRLGVLYLEGRVPLPQVGAAVEDLYKEAGIIGQKDKYGRALAFSVGEGVSSLKKKSHVMKYVFYYLTALKIEGASDREIEREARRMALSYPGGEKP